MSTASWGFARPLKTISRLLYSIGRLAREGCVDVSIALISPGSVKVCVVVTDGSLIARPPRARPDGAIAPHPRRPAHGAPPPAAFRLGGDGPA